MKASFLFHLTRTAFLVSMVMGFTLTSCNKAPQSASNTTSNPKSPLHLGISTPSADHGWTGGVVWWAQKTVDELKESHPDIICHFVTADSAAKQVSDVEDLMTHGIQTLVILPQESAPLTPVIHEAHDRGIKIIVVDRGLTDSFGYVNIAGDNKGMAKLSAEWIASELRGKGQIVCLEGLPVQINKERVDAFNDVIKQHPDIKILDSQLANWSTQKGLEIMENYLQKFPHIDAVFAQDDDVLKGVLQAYKESGRKDIQLMMGGGGSKDIFEMIQKGDPLVRATATYHPSMVRDAIEYAVGVLDGTKSSDFHESAAPLSIVIPSVLVTKDNVAQYDHPDSTY